MQQIVPTVSSSAVGPLGVRHLPRMWLKILLHAKGLLPPGYRHGTGGFDERTALNLGFDRDEFIKFVETKLPTYLECEAWVRAHAKHLDAETIRKHNEAIRRDKPPAAAAAQRAYVGLDDPTVLDATLLNDLDDWMTVHALATKGKIPPLAFSSLNAELTEVLRVVLDATGAERVAMRMDHPPLGLEPSKVAAEAKRDPSAPENAASRVDSVRSTRCTLELESPRTKAPDIIERALARAETLLDEMSPLTAAR